MEPSGAHRTPHYLVAFVLYKGVAMESAQTTYAQAVVKSEAKDDRVGDLKTLYNVSGWSIFWRNFLAGISRALGGIFIYIIFATISTYFLMQTLWPQIEPFINSYQQLLNTLSPGTSTNPSTTPGSAPIEIPLSEIQNDPLFQQLIQKYQ
jgi:hypothetical protein